MNSTPLSIRNLRMNVLHKGWNTNAGAVFPLLVSFLLQTARPRQRRGGLR